MDRTDEELQAWYNATNSTCTPGTDGVSMDDINRVEVVTRQLFSEKQA